MFSANEIYIYIYIYILYIYIYIYTYIYIYIYIYTEREKEREKRERESGPATLKFVSSKMLFKRDMGVELCVEEIWNNWPSPLNHRK